MSEVTVDRPASKPGVAPPRGGRFERTAAEEEGPKPPVGAVREPGEGRLGLFCGVPELTTDPE